MLQPAHEWGKTISAMRIVKNYTPLSTKGPVNWPPRGTAIPVIPRCAANSELRAKGPGPQPGTQFPPEEPFPWLVVVGGLAVVGVGALAVLKGLRDKKPGEKEKKDQGPAGYILQISPTDTIKVSTKERGSFTATAWKVGENGALSRAGNASITIVPPRDIQGLSVVPGSGMGSVNVSVSLEKPATVGSAKIQVNASAGGKGISTFVTVNFEEEANIEFD